MPTRFDPATGGVVFTPQEKETEVIIKTVADFPTTLSADVVYFIDTWIDMGTRELIAPAGGLFINGHDYFKSGLYSTQNTHTMFKTATGVPTTNVRMRELGMYSSGTSSKLFSLDGTGGSGAIEFDSCNLGDFGGTTTSLGELTGFRQFRTNDCGFFLVQDGLTFSGAWSGGFRISDTISLAGAASSTLFKEGTALTFAGRCKSDINAASLASTITVFNFDEANFTLDAGCQLDGAAFNAAGDAVPNLPASSVKAFFRDCAGIQNTNPGAIMTISTAAVSTITTVNTPVKAAGTTTTTEATWFSQTGNNELTYNSTFTKDFTCIVAARVEGGANDNVAVILRQYDNSAVGYINIRSKLQAINNVIAGTDSAEYVIVANVTMDKNDRLELWVENKTDTTNVTLTLDSSITVNER